jgi:hypothetical protein
MSVHATTPPPPWAGELSVKELMLLAEKAPQVYADLMEGRRRQQRLAWAGMIAQVIGNLSGLAALTICAAVAWHAFDSDAAAQGAAIICTGAVSIVAVFVTGKVAGTRGQGRATSRRQPEPEHFERVVQPAGGDS